MEKIFFQTFVLTALLVTLTSCGEKLDTTFTANSAKLLPIIRNYSDDERTAIYLDFYQTHKQQFGELSEVGVVNCLSDNVYQKSDDFTLEKMAVFCLTSYIQGRRFFKYENHEGKYKGDLSLLKENSFNDDMLGKITKHFNGSEVANVYSVAFTSDYSTMRVAVDSKFQAENLNGFCQQLAGLGVTEKDVIKLTIIAYLSNDYYDQTIHGKSLNAKPAATVSCGNVLL